MYKKSCGKILGALALLFLPCQSAEANNKHLFILTKESNAGDHNQALGIATALKRQIAPEEIQQKIFDISKKEQLLNAVQEAASAAGSRAIVIAAGTPSIEIMASLPRKDRVIMLHSSHQVSSTHKMLKGRVDYIALPQYTVDAETLEELGGPSTKIITTAGVAHNLTPESIKNEYTAHQKEFPDFSAYKGIILGGDAELPGVDEKGKTKWLYYTPEEARKLARYLIRDANENRKHLLILNGPRSGKHDLQTGMERENNHRNGTLDPVTAAFIQELEEQGLKKSVDYSLFDFQYGSPSRYKAVLGALLVTGSPLLVAGESTSMVSESADCLPQGLVTAYYHSAMNVNHKKHCQMENKAGRINILSLEKDKAEFIPAAIAAGQETVSQPASDVIAAAVLKRFTQL